MYISSIIIKNFRCFGEASTTISLDKDITFFVGNNGSGKTTVFTALKRLFGESREDRTIVKEDFHLKPNETIDDAQDREMFIDVIFTFPEVATSNIINSILPGFEHVIYSTPEGSFKAKIRLEAKWTSNEYDDEVESKLYWITTDSEIGFGDDFENKTIVTNQERKVIQFRYIPAFRHSNAILKNNIQYLIKIITDYVDINEESSISGESSKEDEIKILNDKLREEIKEIRALKEIKNLIDKNWIKTHDDALKYCQETQFEVTPSEIKDLLKSIHLKLSPAESGDSCDIDMLSDGQVSLLYFTLAITLFEIEQKHCKDEINGLKTYDKLPALFTIFAIEEPENHLSPFYLGRVLNLLNKAINDNANIVGFVSSHSASVIRRVKKLEQIRYFRQDISNENRISQISALKLPTDRGEEAYKYINQAVLAHPELYFAKLVILGEGDSEEIIIPKLASNLGIDLDPSFVAFVKLGGRHVNHMWKLLNDLKISYLTLLDFDLGRKDAGIKRFKYAIDELNKLEINFEYPTGITYKMISDETLTKDQAWAVLLKLEQYNIFYSTPLDLDMSMIRDFPEYYRDNANNSERKDLEKAVLGDKGDYSKYELFECELTDDLLKKYRYLFCSKSKVSSHYLAIEEIIKLDTLDIESKCPKRIKALINKAKDILYPEERNAD
jgi:putative ATP-dependent endonuclease of OLD family